MKLTKEQRDILKGSQGEIMAKVMKTLVMYGQTFGADKLVPVTSKYNHLVTSFGLQMMTPVFDLMQKLIDAGVTSGQPFSVDPRPMDKAVPANPLQSLIFKKFMYSEQKSYEDQLKKLGLMNDSAFTCACYVDQVGNKPGMGDVLSWAESSAVVYANSVLGARCNRNSGIMDLMGSIAGVVPNFGLLTDEGRKAKWIIKVQTTKQPEAQLLGSAIGMKVMEDVPYITGMRKWLGTELTEAVCGYLKDFGAAAASNGAVGLFHVEELTPEAKEQGAALIQENCKVYVIDDAELERVKKSYPVMWKRKQGKPQLCFIGCPHLNLQQLINWTLRIERALQDVERKKVYIPTVITAAPAVLRAFEETEYAKRLKDTGVILSCICPLMYMNNPLCESMRVITPSNKLRTYSTAKYYTEDEILRQITKGGTVT